MIRLVCGPPGAGKSTFVDQRAQPGDVVVDLDRIRATGVSDATAERIRGYLEDHAREHEDGDVWIVRTLAEAKEREGFASTVGAEETTVLATPAVIAKQRASSRDGSPDKDNTIDRWWATYTPSPGDTTIGAPDMGNLNTETTHPAGTEGNPQEQETPGTPQGGEQGERGWPADTPVAEMTAEQAAAYWKHHSRKHEGRARELEEQARKDAADAAAWREHKENQKPEEQRASEDAVRKAVAEAEARVRAETTGKIFQAEFRAAAARKGVDADAQLDYLDQARFITEAGDVDTDKITSFLETLPTGTQQTQGLPTDFGGAPKFEGGSGLDIGRELYKQLHGTK